MVEEDSCPTKYKLAVGAEKDEDEEVKMEVVNQNSTAAVVSGGWLVAVATAEAVAMAAALNLLARVVVHI